MDVSFADERLDRLEQDPSYSAGFSPAVVKGYRKRMQQIRAAKDDRAFYALKSLHYEKLKGRGEQHSMRINLQWRLVIEVKGAAQNRFVVVVSIEDYH